MAQKSWAWFQARAGKVTGSELKNLITDKLAIRKWNTDMPNTYLHRKLAEKWRGEALQSFSGNQQTDQGVIYEERARTYFASLLETDIATVGGIESDDGKLWCSPDGMIGDHVGLEIKCPNADTHVGWLLGDGLPEEHVLQVNFPFVIGDFAEWKFLSYCKDLPHLTVTVTRDKDIVALIQDAVGQFNEQMIAAWNHLIDLNGGPPPERKPFVPSSDDDPRAALFAGLPGEHDALHLIP